MNKAEELFEEENMKQYLSYANKMIQQEPTILFTAEVEKQRIADAQNFRASSKAQKKSKWELLTTPSLTQAIHFARDNGWKSKKVQVKGYRINDTEMEYTVEPWEKDCKCPNLLRYEDYFS